MERRGDVVVEGLDRSSFGFGWLGAFLDRV